MDNLDRPDSDPAAPIGEVGYRVQPGDCLSSIADRFGRRWQTVWNYPANAALKSVRKNPNVLLPGDHIVLPPLNLKEESCVTEVRHHFVKLREPTFLRLVIRDEGQPVTNAPFTISTTSTTCRGETGHDGEIEVQISAADTSATVIVERDQKEPLVYNLRLGHVDPVASLKGVQQRLKNLGFDCGAIDGDLGPKTKDALGRFQLWAGLDATEKADEDTRQKLLVEHKC